MAASVSAAIVWLCSVVSTRLALAFLRRRQIVDLPNARSSHSAPTPRGLGIGLVPVVVLSFAVLTQGTAIARETLCMCAGAAVLMAVSWIDDLRDLPIAPRLAAQFGVAIMGVLVLDVPRDFVVHAVAFRTILVIVWVGLINQVNFTDGIDGNLGAFLVSVGAGLFAVSRIGAESLRETGVLALMMAAAAAGFLVWNWHPARAFMGDVGSVPLGFLAGWLLIRTALAGYWRVALILPLFYFADTFVTYSRRVTRVRAFWRPHREYLYQQATRFKTHAQIVGAAIACNVMLILAAVSAVRGRQTLSLVLSVVAVCTTCAYLSRGIWWGTAPDRSSNS